MVRDCLDDDGVHVRIVARYPVADAPEGELWLKAVLRVYVY